MNESNMAPYFPEAGNLYGSNAEMCFNVVGLSSSHSGDLFEVLDRSNKIISPTTSPNGHHLGFERGYNFHTTFRAYVMPLCIRSIENTIFKNAKQLLYSWSFQKFHSQILIYPNKIIYRGNL